MTKLCGTRSFSQTDVWGVVLCAHVTSRLVESVRGSDDEGPVAVVLCGRGDAPARTPMPFCVVFFFFSRSVQKKTTLT